MIDIFKSDGKKVIVAIYPDSDLAVSVSGQVGLIIGDRDKFEELRVILNNLCGGWDKEQIDKVAFKHTKPSREEIRQTIYHLHDDEGWPSKDIAAKLDLKEQQVRSIIGARNRKKPSTIILSNEKRIDNIITEGIRTGKRYIDIANTINREVGGNWLPDDVHKRVKELEG